VKNYFCHFEIKFGWLPAVSDAYRSHKLPGIFLRSPALMRIARKKRS
jgi:hypothetical protein